MIIPLPKHSQSKLNVQNHYYFQKNLNNSIKYFNILEILNHLKKKDRL